MIAGTHGSTFGGNPLAMTVGNAVMDVVSKKSFLNKVKINSKYFHNELLKIKAKFPKIIKEIRGRGFLIGIQLYKNQSIFIDDLIANKLLTIKASENTVRILPPLNVKKSELIQAIKIISKVCSKHN
jgi:acetylornithine/N-succinyldiaminopimelate aminotransferase